MRTLCDERGGCSFALYLGDNIYDDGIDTDEDFRTLNSKINSSSRMRLSTSPFT